MKLKALTSLSLLGTLMGCSTIMPGTPGGQAVSIHKDGVPTLVAAAPRLKPTLSATDSMYAMARLAHAEGQLAMAAQRYEHVLSLKSDHVGALNALGVIRSQNGRTSEALELFGRARDLAPLAAHIHNNIGYTLLREERLDEAQEALTRALTLQPDNAQTRWNMEQLAKARADQDSARTAAPVQPAPLPGREEQAPAIVAVAPNVFELRLSRSLNRLPNLEVARSPETASPAAQPAEVAAVVPADNQAPGYQLVLSRELTLQAGPFAIWTDVRGVKLEVSNGVGIPQLAKRTAVRLAEAGVATSRLTNARPYRQERTQIQYLPGQHAAVKALAARLPVPVEMVQVGQFKSRVQLRLVLGHDVAGRAIASWIDGSKPTHLALQTAKNGPLS